MTGREIAAEMIGAALGYVLVVLVWVVGLAGAAFVLGIAFRLLIALALAGAETAGRWL